jgi:glycosyltransferase involved in cell wall biosynthesis
MNRSDHLLTIVVPAWKPDFLAAALESIAGQTDRRFSVVIFDDAGPIEVRNIAQKYPSFSYVRFEQNLGGRDLVGHWNRCLSMVKTPWIWLFSDDDVMSELCVAGFYEALDQAPEAKLFQLSVKQVDESLSHLCESQAVMHETVLEFIAARFRSAKVSCVPDHIFNWHELSSLEQGFVNFPLAWNSDDATWVVLATKHGIYGIQKGEVLWRQSRQNISASQKNSVVKLEADVLYLNWLRARGYLPQYLLAVRWLAARISRAYGFRLSDTKKILDILPLWLKPAGAIALIYPVIRASKGLLKRA